MPTQPGSPAYPHVNDSGPMSFTEPGLTKREYFAAAAMQGILANKAMVKKINDYADTQDEDINELLGEVATEFADGLIEALNKDSK